MERTLLGVGPIGGLHMQKAKVVERRRMFRALPGVDLVFLFAVGILGVAACVAIVLR